MSSPLSRDSSISMTGTAKASPKGSANAQDNDPGPRAIVSLGFLLIWYLFFTHSGYDFFFSSETLSQPDSSSALASFSSLQDSLLYPLSSTMVFSKTAVAATAWLMAATGAVANPVSWKRADIDSFVTTQRPIALTKLLCNIGSSGCAASGASPGIVVASPSKSDPDYWYTWTRDAGLVLKELIDNVNTNTELLLPEIENYVTSQAHLQTVSNPSGTLALGTGLAEPKFNVDMTQFTGAWGRPQRDGPALRATALIGYYNYLLDNEISTDCKLWQVIQNDLNYVAQYWNNTGFDLWEEVQGSSFFTVGAQYRALAEGSALAARLGKAHTGYDAVSPQILCYLQTFWSSSKGHIVSNVQTNVGRTGLDANSALLSIHLFDPAVGCDDSTFQPCAPKQLITTKKLIDSFRTVYSINSGKAAGTAIAIGRYAEDVYYNGNPWYLCTLAVAEQLYDSVIAWKAAGSITVTSTSLPFFTDLLPSLTAGTYASDSSTFQSIITAVTNYADGFVEIVKTYTPSDGSLAEQFDKSNGTPLSAHDLTWSYAAFLSATERRAGTVPPGWIGAASVSVPTTCTPTTVTGTYVAASNCASSGAGNGNSGEPDDGSNDAKLIFNELAVTYFGENIKVVGNTTDFGAWDPASGVLLSADAYTDSNPLWSLTTSIARGTGLEFKFIRVGSDGAITWESGDNKVLTAGSEANTITVSATWNSGYSVNSS
ncbi:glycosyl hydrolase family 15 [Ceratocystis lukuohia]